MANPPARRNRRFGWIRRPLSLGGKLVLILSGVGLAGAIAITLLLAAIITPSFTELEDKAVARQVERTRATLSDYATRVEAAVRDYGDWTESYDYMLRADPQFERQSMSLAALGNIGIDGLAYVQPSGRLAMARWRGGANGDTGGIDGPADRERMIGVIDRTDLARVVAARNSGHFYARIGDRVAAIGVARVRRSDGSGVARGYVVMARIVTAGRLSQLLGQAVRLDPAGVSGTAATIVRNRSHLMIAMPLTGADGNAVATVRFAVPRDVSLLGRHMLLLAALGATILLALVLIVMRRVIAHLVLRPLHRVERHMQHVRTSGSLALLDEEGRRDEIGLLGQSFNAMLRQLQDLRGQIEVQSFDLGRSESAVAVMHNVRNALNPISTILGRRIGEPAPLDRLTLERALDELAAGDLAEPRRRKLVAFVTAAIRADGVDRDQISRERRIGREAMAHVLEIIGQQQDAALARPSLDPCDVCAIIARNAAIARYAQDASIAFSFPAGPVFALANRVILSQVVGNLFANAAEAIVARGIGSGSITVLTTERDDHVEITIRDDGEGFPGDIAATLFQRGFSTRAHKSGGLGLHWCANSMIAMGGALRLESDGVGLGAVAILTLQAADVEPEAR